MPETSASIVIAVYKRADWLARCLAALEKQCAADPFQAVVIDDGSPNREEIARVVQASSLPILFRRQENAGPAAARNHGVRVGSGAVVCFLDDDSVPDHDWLKEMLATFREVPGAAVVNGRTRSYDRDNPMALLLEREVYPAKNWATCNIAYRREVLEALGGFDESFPEPSWEDNDLGLRARWAGYRHEYSPRAVVYHPHEATLDEYRQKCRLNGRGAAVFSRKYLFKKPVWGLATPFLMSRRLLLGLLPSVWLKRSGGAYLKFLWSFYSLQGFLGSFASGKYGKN